MTLTRYNAPTVPGLTLRTWYYHKSGKGRNSMFWLFEDQADSDQLWLFYQDKLVKLENAKGYERVKVANASSKRLSLLLNGYYRTYSVKDGKWLSETREYDYEVIEPKARDNCISYIYNFNPPRVERLAVLKEWEGSLVWNTILPSDPVEDEGITEVYAFDRGFTSKLVLKPFGTINLGAGTSFLVSYSHFARFDGLIYPTVGNVVRAVYVHEP